MSKHRVDATVYCPYYLHEDTQVIYCEGVQEGAVTHVAFANRTDAKDYKNDRCRRDYQSCLIYEALEGKKCVRFPRS